jgi:hypothetical protein
MILVTYDTKMNIRAAIGDRQRISKNATMFSLILIEIMDALLWE